MELRKPCYYEAFHCLAGACPDSCCQEWDVDIDPDTAAYYRALPGELGERLRQVLADTEYGTVMTIENGRCPMWRQDGLCRIQAELGEDALSHVCKTFPRLCHDYGNFQELGLELSCPEAARLILENPDPEILSQECPGGEIPDYDDEAMEILLAGREKARQLLREIADPGRALAAVLLHSYMVQAALDGEESSDFSLEAALETAAQMAQSGDLTGFFDSFRGLEILTPRWRALLETPRRSALPEKARALCRYFLDRYYLQAVSDYDLVCRVKFAVISCIAVSNLPGAFGKIAQLYSKEIENDPENLDALLDAAYENPAFTDRKLLGMLLGTA